MRLIIDTDAGVDDAQAIIMALTYPGVTVEAITTVTGNVHVTQVTPNVLTILDLIGCDVPVYQGADQPLLPGFWEPENRVHGNDGLGNLPNRVPSRRSVEPESAAVALVRLANEAPGEFTLIALGPMTNVALACRLDPAFPQKIKRFVFMGGTISAFGNTKHVTAEFNVHCDPEAAYMVLHAFPASTMLSWETTVQHPFPWEQYEELAAINTPVGRFFRDTTAPSVKFLKGFRQLRGFLLPDPLAMALTLNPGVIEASDKHFVTVELQGLQTRGQTVVDYLGLLGQPPNVHVVTQVKVDQIYQMYLDMLS